MVFSTCFVVMLTRSYPGKNTNRQSFYGPLFFKREAVAFVLKAVLVYVLVRDGGELLGARSISAKEWEPEFLVGNAEAAEVHGLDRQRWQRWLQPVHPESVLAMACMPSALPQHGGMASTLLFLSNHGFLQYTFVSRAPSKKERKTRSVSGRVEKYPKSLSKQRRNHVVLRQFPPYWEFCGLRGKCWETGDFFPFEIH